MLTYTIFKHRLYQQFISKLHGVLKLRAETMFEHFLRNGKLNKVFDHKFHCDVAFLHLLKTPSGNGKTTLSSFIIVSNTNCLKEAWKSKSINFYYLFRQFITEIQWKAWCITFDITMFVAKLYTSVTNFYIQIVLFTKFNKIADYLKYYCMYYLYKVF